jgi:RNA polymerase sigma-70 factor
MRDSKRWFEILVREHSQMLTAFLRAAGADHSLADDLWQETMLTAWRRIDDFDPSRPFGPWLRGIAQRLLMARRRTDSRLTLVDDIESLDYLSQRFENVQSLRGDTLPEKLAALRTCIDRLPPNDRECIELRYQQEMTPAVICEHLKLELETIKKRLHRAKQRLFDCLQTKLTADAS